MNLEQGTEMLKIFKDYDVHTSLLDDFDFYNEREKSSKERRARQQTSMRRDAANPLADDPINLISDGFNQALQLDESGKEAPASERAAISRTDPVTASSALINPTSDDLSGTTQPVKMIVKETLAIETAGGEQKK